MTDKEIIEREAQKSACIDVCLLFGVSIVVTTIISSLLMYFPQAWPWILFGSIGMFILYAFYDTRKSHYLDKYNSYKRLVK